MFSPVPYFNRQLTDPVSINGVIFPADTMVDIMPWVLHHNPAVWKNPSVSLEMSSALLNRGHVLFE